MRLGLPAVTPHSARHSFIRRSRRRGVEVGVQPSGGRTTSFNCRRIQNPGLPL